MKVTIQNRDAVMVGDMEPGTVFRRRSDGLYFLKTSKPGNFLSAHEGYPNGESTTCCVCLLDWAVHNVRNHTVGEIVPNAELTISW